MAIIVNPHVSPRIVTVLSPITEITIQDLTNQMKDWEDEPASLPFPNLVLTYGKQSLGGGSYVGITAVLQNTKISFEARPGPTEVQCTITGGNLVAVDSDGVNMYPIEPTAYTQVVIQQSTSPSIATPESDYALMYMVENLTGTHKSVGSVFYWDPEGGSDANNGLTPSNAKATYSGVEALCTAGNHDIIFALATGGVVTYTTPINITKDTVKLRGPGYQFQLVPSSSGNDTVTVSASSVELSGFYIQTASGGTDDAITVASGENNVMIKDCWVDSPTGNGIVINGASRTKIQTCAIESAGSVGIQINNSSTLSKISNCIVTGSTSDGVDITGSSSSDNIFETNLIYNNGGYGVDIGTGVTRTGIRLNHTFSGNTSGSTRDLGSNTFIETPSGGASASDIADAVWDELIADHQTTGTAGKTLKDAKTRATLASLK